ncbi:MAG: oxidoreductase, partial [Calditrichaeota bacterium]
MSKETFQLAIIGCGRWGRNHIRTAAELFASKLKYVCDISEPQLQEARSLAPQATPTTDIETVLKDPQITAVILSTPAETHYELARMVLENGKHVLVEKPLALFSHQAKELEALARKKKRVLMVGHLLIYHPAIRKIKELIEQGTLGKLEYIYSNRLNLGTVRREENILWSFAPHDISVLQYLINSYPEDVDATGGIFLQPGIHDVTLTMLRYPNNILAHIHVSWLHPFKEHRLVVIGDKSMLVFEDTKPQDKLILYPKGIDWIRGELIKRDEGFEVIDYPDEMPLKLEQQHFYDCVVNGKTPETDGQNGILVLEILEQAQQKLEMKTLQKGKVEKESTTGKKSKYFVHETAVVDEGCEIGEGTKIWHYSHVQSGAKIGRYCTLG